MDFNKLPALKRITFVLLLNSIMLFFSQRHQHFFFHCLCCTDSKWLLFFIVFLCFAVSCQPCHMGYKGLDVQVSEMKGYCHNKVGLYPTQNFVSGIGSDLLFQFNYLLYRIDYRLTWLSESLLLWISAMINTVKCNSVMKTYFCTFNDK